MIILFWIVCIFVISIIVGEVRFRHLGIIKKDSKILISKDWKDSINADMDRLHMEKSVSDFVPTTTIVMRGSWRLAQKSVMDATDFTELKAIEYGKSL